MINRNFFGTLLIAAVLLLVGCGGNSSNPAPECVGADECSNPTTVGETYSFTLVSPVGNLVSISMDGEVVAENTDRVLIEDVPAGVHTLEAKSAEYLFIPWQIEITEDGQLLIQTRWTSHSEVPGSIACPDLNEECSFVGWTGEGACGVKIDGRYQHQGDNYWADLWSEVYTHDYDGDDQWDDYEVILLADGMGEDGGTLTDHEYLAVMLTGAVVTGQFSQDKTEFVKNVYTDTGDLFETEIWVLDE